MKFFNYFLNIILTLSLIMGAGGCRKDYNRLEGFIWNTTYSVIYDGNKNLTDSVCDVLQNVGHSLNVFDDSSLVCLVNKNDSAIVDQNFIRVYEMSKHIYRESDGAFDPTLGPLIDAWGFGRGHVANSDTLHLDSLISFTGISKTQLKGNVLYKTHPLIRFNFSAIAKGYGCDRIAEMLSEHGAHSYLVEIGGEIRCAGKSPSGGKWRISIDKPILSDSILHDSQCIIEVSQAGIATSGNYRNFHKSGNTIYGHTISSQTGRPVQTDVLSATVVTKTAMEADALATTIMAMGSTKGLELASRLNFAVLMVLADGTTIQNDAFTSLLSIE